MRVSSVKLGAGVQHASEVVAEPVLSEFVFLPKQNCNKSCISANGLKKLLAGLGAIAVAITLSRVKIPLKKEALKPLNIFC